MSETPLLLAFSAVAVVDTVLLAILLERRAWRGSLAPLIGVAAGALLFHAGRALDLSLRSSQEFGDGWRIAAPLLTSAGALLIPSALLHAALRLLDSGLQGRLRFDPRYALCYAPLAILLSIPSQLAEAPGGTLLDAVGPLFIPYAVWVTLVSLCLAAVLFALRGAARRVRVATFLTRASLLLGGWTLLFWVFCSAGVLRPAWREASVLVVGLGPTVLALLVAQHVVRFHFWSLLAERTAVLAAATAVVVAFHLFVLTALRPWLPLGGAGLMVLEAAVILGAAGAYGPVRAALKRQASGAPARAHFA